MYSVFFLIFAVTMAYLALSYELVWLKFILSWAEERLCLVRQIAWEDGSRSLN